MTDVDETTYWHQDCDVPTPHGPHPTFVKRCAHEHNTWCWGVPELGSLAEKVAALKPGQLVRVIYEAVVNEPMHPNKAERQAVSAGTHNGHIVLRYTGTHPASAKLDDGEAVAGLVVPTLADVQVLLDHSHPPDVSPSAISSAHLYDHHDLARVEARSPEKLTPYALLLWHSKQHENGVME